MSFLKKGAPQPIKIASGLCEECGKEPATSFSNGKMLCQKCKEASSQNA